MSSCCEDVRSRAFQSCSGDSVVGVVSPVTRNESKGSLGTGRKKLVGEVARWDMGYESKIWLRMCPMLAGGGVLSVLAQ